MFTKVKTATEIAAMRESGRMLAVVLRQLEQKITSGMSTYDLAQIAGSELRLLGGEPAFLGYHGFPDVLCVSVNEEVVHGIPRPDRVIAEGDIVSMDFGVKYREMITDAAISVIVGKTDDKSSEELVRTTQRALEQGISMLCHGIRVGDLAHSIEEVLNAKRYGIVRDLVGHGVGHYLHEEPNIPNYGSAGTGPVLKSGMTIAIEPMATLGDYRVYVANDGWTILTQDGSRAAHFEHTVLITTDGAEILTTL